MEETKSVTGSCLCGSVKLKAEKMDPKLGVCHCTRCRKWSAGPFLAVDCGAELTMEGEEFVERFESSEWAQRGFCKKCGTSLFYFLKPAGQYIVSSEVFSESELVFDHEIFVDEKPAYYDFAGESKKMTGAEVFAAFEANQ